MLIIKIKNIQNNKNKNDRHNNTKNIKNFNNNKIKPASVFLILLVFLLAAAAYSLFLPNSSEAAVPHTGGPLPLFHKNTLYYTGTIITLNNTVLKLSGITATPLLFEINSSTICYGGVGLKAASCSDYKKGQTVSITASKNTAGELIAKTIKPVFY